MPELGYLEKKKETDSLFNAGSYKECVVNFNEMQKDYRLAQRDLYREAYSYFQLNNDMLTEKTLKEMDAKGMLYPDTAIIEKDYLLNQNKPYLARYKQLFKNKCLNYKKVSNLSLLDSLLRREALDQQYRKLDKSHLSQGQRDSLLQLQNAVDSLNQVWLANVIQQFGWPGYKQVGYEGDQAAWVIIQHADNNVAFQKKYLRLITNEIAANNSNAQNFAYLTDRILINSGEPQIYGTQFDENRTDSTLILTSKTLIYPQLVNTLRDFAAMGSIEAYLDYSTNYFKKKYGIKN